MYWVNAGIKKPRRPEGQRGKVFGSVADQPPSFTFKIVPMSQPTAPFDGGPTIHPAIVPVPTRARTASCFFESTPPLAYRRDFQRRQQKRLCLDARASRAGQLG
jgi:hypothetical protein